MAKKLTIEFVKESFEKKEYDLLTTEYINSKQKLDYICPKGHRHSMCWDSWKQGHGCPSCVGVNKPLIDFINGSIEKEDYTLLTKKYVNNRQKLEYICPEGHKHSTTWSNWQQGYRCPYCAGLTKPLIEFVKESFEKDSYNLLTKKYINSQTKLYYICPNGHRHFIIWNMWQQGNRCPICAIINKHGCGNPNWKGGISKEPYCQDWTDVLKGFVKERDGLKCLNPYCISNDKNDLTVHHIDYNKKFCGPENLITVCRSCNSRANKDRKWHKNWYQAILHKRYNYMYL